MKLLNFTIIKLTLLLIAGILIGYYYPVDFITLLITTFLLLTTTLVSYFYCKKLETNSLYFDCLTCLTLIAVGSLSITTHSHHNNPKHYSHFISETATQKLRIQIFKKLKPNSFYTKYLGKVTVLNNKKTMGIMLINVDSTQQLSIDNSLYVNTKIIEIQKPLNPHQFDFKAYMKKQQVYDQIFLNKHNNIKLMNQYSFYGYADNIRKRINTNLKKHPFSVVNLSIINALLLGQRQDISKDTYKSFTQSGTIHILAISGLHIGLLMLLLGWVLKPLAYFKNGKKAIPFIIIILLWSYAFLTGLSASVLRAVTMFTLFTIALYHNRITNTYNTLVISAFILILINPYYVFDIGFQLSYSAVFAIITIKPLFNKLWNPTSFLTKKFWDVFTVTLSAQFGILPLSLYYFHQFPSLFVLANLIIIPLLGILLGVGILVLVLAYFDLLPDFLFLILDSSISALMTFVATIGHQKHFVLTHIPFNSINLITTSLFSIGIILIWQKKSFKHIVFLLFSIISVQLGFIINKNNSQTEKLVIFNQYKTTLIAHKKGNQLHYSGYNIRYQQSLDNYAINEFTQNTIKDSIQNCYLFKDKKILIVDKSGIYNTSFAPDIVLLTQSPKINLNRLIKTLNPRQIVADNNNYKSSITRWQQTCASKEIPFHFTGKVGALILQ